MKAKCALAVANVTTLLIIGIGAALIAPGAIFLVVAKNENLALALLTVTVGITLAIMLLRLAVLELRDLPGSSRPRLMSEPHFHIVELTDPAAVEYLLTEDHKALPAGTEVRAFHVFITAVVDGRLCSLSDGNQTWVFDLETVEHLHLDAIGGWSGVWNESPACFRDEFAEAETGAFMIEGMTITPMVAGAAPYFKEDN